ncbi:MAG: HYR domain-containing protein, partial [Salinivirgaceae bacterium]|nr:HYR domain-containing protein [Salinivirgaceae bacterium]
MKLKNYLKHIREKNIFNFLIKCLLLVFAITITCSENLHAQYTITSNDGGVTAITGSTSSPIGNSFTANGVGKLSALKVINYASSTNNTLKIYKGEGVEGDLLATITGVNLSESSNYSDYNVIDLTPYRIPVIPGYRCTFYFDNDNSGITSGDGTMYDGGKRYYSGALEEDSDLYFEIAYTPLNIAPNMSISNTSLSYTEDEPSIQVDASATANDINGDSDWNGGILTAQITTNSESGDKLSIPDNIVGTINTSGTNLRNGITSIGTLSASEGTVTNGSMLTITFNANATNSLVQQTLRSISYRSTSQDPGTLNRIVSFVLRDNNGGHEVDTRTIEITTADNDVPTISTNGNLSLNEGATATITTGTHLAATDVDDTDATLIFLITRNTTNGAVKKSGSTITTSGAFTQADLTSGDITYVHDGSNTTSDSFTFKVSDGTNELTNQTFSITINAVDDDAPTMVTNNGLRLNEGETMYIPIDSLESDDSDTDNSILIYTITSSPNYGQLENTDNSGISINSFTQQNVIDDKIQYVHDGSNTTSDSFTFKVADGTPNELTGQTFSITINAVDDDAPVIFSTPSNISVNTDSGDDSAIVTWASPFATDDFGVVYFFSDHSNGAKFPVGVTTVIYTVRDAAGNSATSSFTITVSDNEDPTISSTPANIFANTDAGDDGAIVTWLTATSSDNVAVTSFSSDYESGDKFALGLTT